MFDYYVGWMDQPRSSLSFYRQRQRFFTDLRPVPLAHLRFFPDNPHQEIPQRIYVLPPDALLGLVLVKCRRSKTPEIMERFEPKARTQGNPVKDQNGAVHFVVVPRQEGPFCRHFRKAREADNRIAYQGKL